MKISLIAAMDINRVIGFKDQLPWHLPADLKHFKQLTLGKPAIMGRKTFISIGKPLLKRHNIVITHNPQFNAPGITVVHSIEDAFKVAVQSEEVMVIGGAGIFQQVLPTADKMYLTMIEAEFEGDCYFPQWDKDQWEIIDEQSHQANSHHPYSFRFLTLIRKKK